MRQQVIMLLMMMASLYLRIAYASESPMFLLVVLFVLPSVSYFDRVEFSLVVAVASVIGLHVYCTRFLEGKILDLHTVYAVILVPALLQASFYTVSVSKLREQVAEKSKHAEEIARASKSKSLFLSIIGHEVCYLVCIFFS